MAKLEKSLQNLDDGDSLHAELVECKKYEMYAVMAWRVLQEKPPHSAFGRMANLAAR